MNSNKETQKIITFKPCQGRLPLRKYMNICPKASKSSLLLCSEIEENRKFHFHLPVKDSKMEIISKFMT